MKKPLIVDFNDPAIAGDGHWLRQKPAREAGWDPEKHPRNPAGSAAGGEFTSSGGAFGPGEHPVHGPTGERVLTDSTDPNRHFWTHELAQYEPWGKETAAKLGVPVWVSSDWPEAGEGAPPGAKWTKDRPVGTKLNIFPGHGPGMVVAGHAMAEGGHFNPQNNEIVLFLDENSERGMTQMLAHEVQHKRFHEVTEWTGLGKQFDPTTYGEKVKAINSVKKFEVENMRQLQAYAPMLSGYAKDWWSAVDKGEATIKQAVNESLAETARLYAVDHKKFVPKVWQDYFEKFAEVYDKHFKGGKP